MVFIYSLYFAFLVLFTANILGFCGKNVKNNCGKNAAPSTSKDEPKAKQPAKSSVSKSIRSPIDSTQSSERNTEESKNNVKKKDEKLSTNTWEEGISGLEDVSLKTGILPTKKNIEPMSTNKLVKANCLCTDQIFNGAFERRQEVQKCYDMALLSDIDDISHGSDYLNPNRSSQLGSYCSSC